MTIGQYESGEWNAITDVPGVKVGHVTISEGQRSIDIQDMDRFGQESPLLFLVTMCGITRSQQERLS